MLLWILYFLDKKCYLTILKNIIVHNFYFYLPNRFLKIYIISINMLYVILTEKSIVHII